MYRLSKYWNRFAYLIIKLGIWLLWDYTGQNKDLVANLKWSADDDTQILRDQV